ncbi:DNA-binding transcriptional regulator [soil metagenome]
MHRAPADTNSYWPVRGLLRGLEVLRVLNRLPVGTGSVATIARETGLHRTTVKRLLESLLQAGFVRVVSGGREYRLTFRVRELSAGFEDDAWVSEVAGPLLRELTDAVKWPSDLVTLEGDELVVRESTHPFSPLSFRGGALGVRVPLLRTAVGRAYLSWCPDDERDALLMLLGSRDDAQGREARDEARVHRLIERTRDCGYAVSSSTEQPDESRFGAIAVPVRRAPGVVACINIVFLLRAASADSIAAAALSRLLTTARAIESALVD